MYRHLLLLITCAGLSYNSDLICQPQTVGIFLNDSTSLNGYTLFSPVASRETYLIDNCGHEINRWTFDNVPGMMTYLLEDGSVMRASRTFSGFGAGGSGGLIQRKSWDDTLTWSYAYSSDSLKQHHDIEVLDNGNVLLIAWERRPDAEILQAGRIPEALGSAGLWMEQIVELKPLGTDSAEIVWEWHLYDHLVQDVDPSLDNFGEIHEHPGKLDINYRAFSDAQLMTPGSADWVHLNAIDYNPDLDLIVISARNTNEIYVLDHSTTTMEARGSSGGNYGRGGDFIFRYGNDAVFNNAGGTVQHFYAQHDASWVRQNGSYTGEISVFNNGLGRNDNISSAEILTPRFSAGGFDYDNQERRYILDDYFVLFASTQYPFSSPRISGVQVLNNDNLLICSGNHGAFYEIDREGRLVWNYVNPISQTGPIPQGVGPVLNDVFRTLRYTPDFPGFEGRDLTPGTFLELQPLDYDCQINNGTVSTHENAAFSELSVYPNPVHDKLHIAGWRTGQCNPEALIYNISGEILMRPDLSDELVDLSLLNAGIYFLHLQCSDTVRVVKFVKQ